MIQQISLKEAERKIFKATFQDGLWDIFIGCVVLQFGIAPLLSSRLGDFWSSAVFLPFWVLIFGLIWLTKKLIVIPRLGSVKFRATRKMKLTKFTSIMLIINLTAFIIGFYFSIQSKFASGILPIVAFGFTVLMLSSVAAYFLNSARFFIYGFLVLLSFFVGEWLFIQYKLAHHGFPITFGLTAGIIITTGIIMFLRLLRNNPIPTSETNSEEKIR